MMDLSGFTSSAQGQKALQQLQGHGFTGHQAQSMLGAAVPAAAEAMRGIARGDKSLPKFTESNYVMNFTAGAVSSLIRGQGFMGSAIDGMQGMVGGYIAQVIAARFGLPKRTAGVIGAVITPLAIDFIWAKLEGSGGQQQQQLPPAPAPAQLPPAAPYPGYGQPRGYGYAAQAYAGQGYTAPRYQPGQGYYAAPPVRQAPPGYASSVTGYTPGRGHHR
jgi:hypothetical protein